MLHDGNDIRGARPRQHRHRTPSVMMVRLTRRGLRLRDPRTIGATGAGQLREPSPASARGRRAERRHGQDRGSPRITVHRRLQASRPKTVVSDVTTTNPTPIIQVSVVSRSCVKAKRSSINSR